MQSVLIFNFTVSAYCPMTPSFFKIIFSILFCFVLCFGQMDEFVTSRLVEWNLEELLPTFQGMLFR